MHTKYFLYLFLFLSLRLERGLKGKIFGSFLCYETRELPLPRRRYQHCLDINRVENENVLTDSAPALQLCFALEQEPPASSGGEEEELRKVTRSSPSEDREVPKSPG